MCESQVLPAPYVLCFLLDSQRAHSWHQNFGAKAAIEKGTENVLLVCATSLKGYYIDLCSAMVRASPSYADGTMDSSLTADKEVSWKRVLWKTQPYPDNHVPPEVFLASLQRNGEHNTNPRH